MLKKILSSLLINLLIFPSVFAAAETTDTKQEKTSIIKEFKTGSKSVKFSDNILKRTVDDAIVPKKLKECKI